MLAGWRERRVTQRDLRHAADLWSNAHGLMEQGSAENAERALRESVRLRTKRLGADEAETLVAKISLARALRKQGMSAEAMVELRDVVERATRALGDNHQTTALARVRLAGLLISAGHPQEAEELATAVLATGQSSGVMGLKAWDVKLIALAASGRHAQAATEALALMTESASLSGAHHPRTLKIASHRVQNLVFLGEFDQAEQECRAIITSCSQQGALWLAVNNALVFALNGLGRHDEAEATARAALAQGRQLAQLDGRMPLALALALARTLTARKRYDEALHVALEARAESLQSPGGQRRLPGAVGVVIAHALFGLGRLEEAEVEVREAVAVSESMLSPTHHRALEAATLLGTVLVAQGRRIEAERQLTDCVAAWTTHFGSTHPRTVAATAELAALP
ncbi:tetratricopeptide (TPR) repeat protein [Kitasatospora sp. MAP12-15]|nr:tetratricopeptide (TPR) repeat protein [Kitasatospora sp. MAP12-44]